MIRQRLPQQLCGAALKTDISKHVGFRWWERMDSNHRSEDATDLQGKVIIFHVVLFTGVGDSDKIKMSEYVKRGHCIAEIIRETEIGE